MAKVVCLLFDFKVNAHSPEYHVSPHIIKKERCEIPLETILKIIKKPVLKTVSGFTAMLESKMSMLR